MCALEVENLAVKKPNTQTVNIQSAGSAVSVETTVPVGQSTSKESTPAPGTTVEKNTTSAATASSGESQVTSNIDEFIKSDNKLTQILKNKKLINEQCQIIGTPESVAQAINDYYKDPANMTKLKISSGEESIKEILKNSISEFEDNGSYSIISDTDFKDKIQNIPMNQGSVTFEDDCEPQTLTVTTTMPVEESPMIKYGQVTTKWLKTLHDNFISKYGLEKGEAMYQAELNNKIKNGFIVKVGDNYFAKTDMGIETKLATDDEAKYQQSYLEKYANNPEQAQKVVRDVKYYKAKQQVRADLKAAYDNNSPELTDKLGTRSVRDAIGVEYYSMINRVGENGEMKLVPKYLDANSENWKNFTNYEKKIEDAYRQIAGKKADELTNDDLKVKRQMIETAIALRSDSKFGKTTTFDAERLRTEAGVRDFNFEKEGINIVDLANVAAVNMMPVLKEEDFDLMADTLVKNHDIDEKNSLMNEYDIKIHNASTEDEKAKLRIEKEQKLAELDAKIQQTQIEDMSDYANLMSEGKLKREKAKQKFDNTVPHWDRADKLAAENDGKNHTIIGRKGRKYVENSGDRFAKKDADGNYTGTADDYDFILKDKNGKEVTDSDGKPVYCKFDGDKWKNFWLAQSNMLRKGNDANIDAQYADYFYDLDEIRGSNRQNKSGGVDYHDTMGKKSKSYDKQRDWHQIGDLVESAGLTKEKNNSFWKKLGFVGRKTFEGAAGGAVAQITSNGLGQFNSIKYSDTVRHAISGVTDAQQIHYQDMVSTTDRTITQLANGKELVSEVTHNTKVEGTVTAPGQEYYKEEDIPVSGDVKPEMLEGVPLAMLAGGIAGMTTGIIGAGKIRDKVDGKSDLIQHAQAEWMDNNPAPSSNSIITTQTFNIQRKKVVIDINYKEPDKDPGVIVHTLKSQKLSEGKIKGQLPYLMVEGYFGPRSHYTNEEWKKIQNYVLNTFPELNGKAAEGGKYPIPKLIPENIIGRVINRNDKPTIQEVEYELDDNLQTQKAKEFKKVAGNQVSGKAIATIK